MTVHDLLPGWTTPPVAAEARIRTYSTTADILSFKRCRRQYGFFGVRGFSSATATQRYFGTLVHDVLDRVYRDYRRSQSHGEEAPALPDEEAVGRLVKEAHQRLIRTGVRAVNAQQQQAVATTRVYRFVRLVGAAFFPHVRETEYRLERVLRTPTGREYVLDGVVDILSGAVSHALGLSEATRPDDVEIWDYKSGQRPAPGSPELRDYEFQLRVYAELYRQQRGHYPARCVLAFLGELSQGNWDDDAAGSRRYPGLIYEVRPEPEQVAAAMHDFHATVEAIEAERAKPYAAQWLAPDHEVNAETCDACDLRFNCDAFKAADRLRQQPL